MENNQENQNAPATENPVPEAQTQSEQPQPSAPMTAETPAPKPKSSNKLLIGLIFILLLAFLGGAYFYFRSQSQIQTPGVQELTPPETQETPSPTPDPTADWKTYTTSTYLVKYPEDLITREDEGSTIAISKWGPTQTEGTELFDGYSITFQIKEVSDTTPQEYADTLISETKDVGISEITEEPSAITINSYQGVTYTEEGLGTYKHIILGSDNNSSLMLISIIVSDPGNLGFQETVDQILSTFEFVSGK